MSTLQRRRMMMAQGVTYDGIPLTITNVSNSNVVILIRISGGLAPLLYYKKGDRKTYKRWDYNNITLQPQESMDIFGDNPEGFSKSQTEYINFRSSGDISVSGRVSSLSSAIRNYNYALLFNSANVVSISEDLFVGVNLTPYCFYNAFAYNKNLQEVPSNLLPFTTLSTYCYYQMFANTGLTKIKSGFLPATSVPMNAYGRMFTNTKIDTIEQDAIAATSVVYAEQMFRVTPIDENSFQEGSLKKMTSSGNGSFTRMFDSCNFSKIPPQIQLEAKHNYVYQSTFANNKRLIELDSSAFNSLNITDSGARLYSLTFNGCTSLQKVEIPFGQSKVKGHDRLFQNTFKGCSSLNEIKVHFTSWQYQATVQGVLTTFNLTEEWLAGVSPTGTFICPKELAEETDGYYDDEGNFVAGVGRGSNTVPEGWTIDYPIIDARDGDDNAMALMAVISQQTHADGTPWVKDSLVMMKSEAEKVEDIGTVFRDNKSIKNFEALKYFTKITSIPDNAFYGCSNLTKINIPIQVTHLGTKSFGTTPQLGKIPNHITTFGNLPFYYSTRTLIDISEIKVSSTGSIFQNMYKLGSIELPDQITEISDSAFSGCSALTSFHVHKDIAKIGTRPFLNTNGSVKTITVADNNPIYDSRENCNAIIETATNTLIAGCAKTIIPYGIKEITSGALQGVGLELLTIPSSVTTIGSYCFSGYKGTFVEFPDTIVSNGAQIISDAPNLQEAIVGVNIVNIQSYSFYKCPNLTKLTLKAKSVVIAHNTSLTNTNANLVVYVPSELITAYQEDSFWSKFNIQAIPQ